MSTAVATARHMGPAVRSALARVLDAPPPGASTRRVVRRAAAPGALQGEGFPVRSAFAGLPLELVDPFLMLDHIGATEWEPLEARGAPDHPHRGFETVTYMLAGELVHADSTGGGGLIAPGATQWMTAGDGIIHSEMPTERLLRGGGVLHGLQLWVNLPGAVKRTAPRYQDLTADVVGHGVSADGGAVVRVIGGSLAGVSGPGATHHPVTVAHATVQPGQRLALPWDRRHNAVVYVLGGSGQVGAEGAPLPEGQAAVLSTDGDAVVLRADDVQTGPADAWDVVLLAGEPLRQPVAWYGPFVMSTRAELVEAVEDFRSGRMGTIPAEVARS